MNCSSSTTDNRTGKTPPDRAIHPARTATQAEKQKVSTGLLPRWSRREPKNHRLPRPPRKDTELTRRIAPSDMPVSVLRKATVKATMPPYATEKPTSAQSSFRNGGKRSISSQGTRPLEARVSSGISASGMRLRKVRLTAPIVALKANRMANCQLRGWPARQAAAMRKVMKLARFWTAASRARYLPRNEVGTSAVIHGSQAQLEMPRERLKPNGSINIRARRVSGFRKKPASGTNAIAKMNMTRVPQPA